MLTPAGTAGGEHEAPGPRARPDTPADPRTTRAVPRRTPQSASRPAARRKGMIDEDRPFAEDPPRARRRRPRRRPRWRRAAARAARTSQSGGRQRRWWRHAPAATYTIQMITHEQAGDTFWDKIRAGAEDAAKAHGITLQYSNNQNGPEQATLVQNAIDSKVSASRSPCPTPDAVVPVAQKAVAGRASRSWRSTRASPTTRRPARRCTSARTRRLAGQDRRPEARPGRPGRQDAVRDPGAGLGGAGDPLRRREVGPTPNTENLQVNGADLPSVQQTHPVEAGRRTSRSPISSPWARRSPWPRCRPSRAPAAPRRSSPST